MEENYGNAILFFLELNNNNEVLMSFQVRKNHKTINYSSSSSSSSCELTSSNFKIKNIKILLLGNANSNNSKIIETFSNNLNSFFHVHPNALSIIGIQIQNEEFKLQIQHSLGCERFWTRNNNHLSGYNAAVVSYNICDKNSFENAKKILELLNAYSAAKFQTVLLGEASDITNRAISTKQGKELGEFYNIKYYECSASDKCSLISIFQEITAKINTQFFSELHIEKGLEKAMAKVAPLILVENKLLDPDSAQLVGDYLKHNSSTTNENAS